MRSKAGWIALAWTGGWTAAMAADALAPRRVASELTAPPVAVAPAIDGKLDDAAWSQAQPVRDFAYKTAVRYATEGWICRVGDTLYLAARCFDDNLAGLAKGGAALWRDDCIEIFLVPDREAAYFSHIILTCEGRAEGGTWVRDEWGEPTRGEDLALRCAAGREDAAWTVEAAIPLAPFRRPITDASAWAIGFNREKHSAPAEVSSFMGGFNRPNEYPALRFAPRDLVADGLGVRNRSDAPREVTIAVARIGTNAPPAAASRVTLPPGQRYAADWAPAAAGAAAGDRFAIETRGADGAVLLREEYALVKASAAAATVDPATIPPPRFVKGPLDDPSFFPIGVWGQPAGVAKAYAEMGVNVFVGGADAYPRPKDRDWMDAVHAQGHYAIVPFKKDYVEQRLQDHPAFVAWMYGDEPDNANPQTGAAHFTPEELMVQFAAIRQADATHPIYLNLGQGVAEERFVGRAASDEQYAGYVRAADILCYDVYPCNSVAGGTNRLHLVAKGIDRLRRWGGPEKPAWVWIEANKFGKDESGREPTPDEVKTQVWMALVHGARGYGFFCHSWNASFLAARVGQKKTFSASAIAPDMQAALKAINAEVRELAPVLNSPTVADGAVARTGRDGRVDVMAKRHEGAVVVMAVNMYRRPEQAEITVKGVTDGEAEVLYENRRVPVKNGVLADDFAPYAVHRYRLR